MTWFRKRYRQIKDDVKKYAEEKNVPANAISFWYVFQYILIASGILTLVSLYTLSSVWPDISPIGALVFNLIPVFWFMFLLFGVGKYFYYAKILEIHYINKILAYCIDKLDMIWWRKYRKHSPLTDAISKIMSKKEKAKSRFTKPQRRMIVITFVILFVGFYGYAHMDTFVEFYDSFALIPHEINLQQNQIGRIYDGLNEEINATRP